MPMMAITTSSSTSVKAWCGLRFMMMYLALGDLIEVEWLTLRGLLAI
jgi:hypothetical protein